MLETLSELCLSCQHTVLDSLPVNCHVKLLHRVSMQCVKLMVFEQLRVQVLGCVVVTETACQWQKGRSAPWLKPPQWVLSGTHSQTAHLKDFLNSCGTSVHIKQTVQRLNWVQVGTDFLLNHPLSVHVRDVCTCYNKTKTSAELPQLDFCLLV